MVRRRGRRREGEKKRERRNTRREDKNLNIKVIFDASRDTLSIYCARKKRETREKKENKEKSTK